MQEDSTQIRTKFWIVRIKRSFDYNLYSYLENIRNLYKQLFWVKLSKRLLLFIMLMMKDHPPGNHFYFDYSIDGQLFWSLNQNVGK